MVEVFTVTLVNLTIFLFSIQKPKKNIHIVHSRTFKFLTIHAIKSIDHDITVECAAYPVV